MPAIINPALRPLSEASNSSPIVLYTKDTSPMDVPALGASVELGWVGQGRIAGVHTARYGFFPNGSMTGKKGSSFTWTHFLPLVPMFVPDLSDAKCGECGLPISQCNDLVEYREVVRVLRTLNDTSQAIPAKTLQRALTAAENMLTEIAALRAGKVQS